MLTPKRSFLPVAGWCRAALFLSLAILAGATAQAQSTGTIFGRVTDVSSRLALSGTLVQVRGTALETYTNAGGEYTLNGVPVGAQTMEFGYVGYSELARPVEVTAGQTLRLDVAFGGETVQLNKFVITGSLVGTARAINQQRAADGLTNIIAADDIGQFPDQNAAESLQRVPGLALYRDQGEGRFIIIRGINAQYNRVALNGATVATPEAGSRNAPLDVIGSDSLGAVIVSKVVTPDKDAEGLGGSVDLRTRSAFDAQGRQADLSGQTLYNQQRGRYGYKFNATYGEVFLDGKLGVLLSASKQRRPYGSYNYEEAGGWSLIAAANSPDGQPHYFFNEIAYRDYEIVRTRESTNLALDYKPDATTTISLRASYADFNDTEKRWVTDIPFSKGSITALSDTTASVTGVTAVQKRLRMREKDQKLITSTLGFESQRGDWKLEGALDASEGKEKKPSELEARFDTKAASSWSYVFTDPYHIVSTSIGGDDPSVPAAYSKPNKGTLKGSTGSENSFGAHTSARYDFPATALPTYLKFGAAYRAKDKDLDKEQSSIDAFPAGYAFAALAETGDGDYPYFTGPRINAAALSTLFYGSNSAFTLTRDLDKSYMSDFDAQEDVLAGYAMGGVMVGQLDALAGVRVERTQLETSSYQALTHSGAIAYSRVTAKHDFTSVLPGVVFSWKPGKQLVVRASLTESLSRPDFTQTSLSRVVNDDKSTVTQGNPALKPLESLNWDASAEYYLPSLGVVSAAVFYKDIKNFSYQALAGVDESTGYALTTYLNGSKGHIAGLELAYQQQFRFLPAPFDGLGFLANATFSDSEATYPTRPGEKLDFIGQSKVIGNVALTYDKKGFFLRVAANHRTPRLREDEALSAAAATDRYVDRFLQLDLTTSYKVCKNCEIFAELVNLTNEPFRVYFGGTGAKRLVQREEYGRSANFGVRLKL